jgi:HlyD family secretion protein
MHSRWFILLTASALGAGCNQPSASSPNALVEPPPNPSASAVRIVHPERRTIHREVGQPGSIQAFEETPIVAKVAGYVRKWHVDIGDRVDKSQPLAELDVPELVAELELKEAVVEQARKARTMAEAQVLTAKAQVQEAQDALARAEAMRDYWQSQSTRIAGLVGSNVIDKQTKEETANQSRSATAAFKEAQAKIVSAQALQKEKEAAKDKAEADIRAAEADRRRVAALVGYTRLVAPYKGVVTYRNKDLSIGQFVQPATAGKGDVLYIVQQTDPVRVFVHVPEADAPWVGAGAPALIRVQALPGQEFRGKVKRTAEALNDRTRTLLTEIDLPNPDGRLRPGLYAYGIITGEHPDVLTLPASAVVTQGDVNVGYQTFCYLVEYGKAKRTPIEVGARNEQLVEVLKKQTKPAHDGEQAHWEPFTGEEEVIQGDLSSVKDGQPIEVRAQGDTSRDR